VIRCWECGAEVGVPERDRTGPLIAAMAHAAVDALRWPTAVATLGGAILMAAVLAIPYAGLGLGLALFVAVFAWGYGGQIRVDVPDLDRDPDPGPDASAPRPGSALDDEEVSEPRGAWVARCVLSVLAALALLAPLVVRNRGHAFPPVGPAPSVLGPLGLALAGWLVMPIVLLAAYAHDHRGPLPPRRALRAMVRHLLATVAALAVLPLGLLATELLVAGLAWEQGQLPVMVADLFPPSWLEQRDDGAHMYFDYGGAVLDVKWSDTFDNLVPVYWHGLRRGLTLSGTIPASLSLGPQAARDDLWRFRVGSTHYRVSRFVLTVLIAWSAATLLTIQARWLGLIAALGSALR
jgi:hypothetical protein